MTTDDNRRCHSVIPLSFGAARITTAAAALALIGAGAMAETQAETNRIVAASIEWTVANCDPSAVDPAQIWLARTVIDAQRDPGSMDAARADLDGQIAASFGEDLDAACGWFLDYLDGAGE